MSWGSTIGIAILTGIAGTASAVCLAYVWIIWYRLGTHDGGDLAYYVVFVPLGLLAGLVLGALISRWVPGFWAAQGSALAAVLGLYAAIGLVGRMYGEVAPELDGSQLVLQVELKCPRGWQPDAETRKGTAGGCSLQPVGPGRRLAPTIQGNVDWTHAAQIDGAWVAPCEVYLLSSRETRFVDVTLGETWVEFNLPLPAHPSKENQQWSQWSADGFSQEDGKPPVTGYAYRCRVKRVKEIRDEAPAAVNALWQGRDEAAKAIPEGAPLTQWLPLFEDPDGSPAAYRWGGADRIERRTLAPRVLELAPLLVSSDRTVMRQAVFAVGSLQETPQELVAPLLTAGGMTLTLITEARAAPEEVKTDSERSALQYFTMWRYAIDHTGPGEVPKFRPILEEIERAASSSKTGDIEFVSRHAREYLEALRTAPESGK